ncbi:YqaA family protein [Celerinatantimonas yamalensis]|uniref:YqaA family protein n=1 Tax=Celerinatantimonas yamalensis TaxID=559956 RepID=A0ABW9G3E3_9GAMM
MIGYLILFSSSFLAATILPFYSEVILYAMLTQGDHIVLLVAIASLGNTLGSVVNWYLGKFILRFKGKRWFYFKDQQIERMQYWFQRYGQWCLLFAWLPIGGDALTLVAGIMKVRLSIFLILVGIGKSVRYIAVAYFAYISQGMITHWL